MQRLPLVPDIPDDVLDRRLQTNLGRALYNNPDLCVAFKRLAYGVHGDSHLEPRLRELVILRVSAELGSDVEWGQHLRIATTPEVYGTAWVSVPEARAVRDGRLEEFPSRERIAMQYATAVEHNAVGDELWGSASAELSAVELLDLSVLAGFYGMAGRLTNVLAVPMDDGILPISALDAVA
jgi:4-carboxymuconolactone decarboxylase